MKIDCRGDDELEQLRAKIADLEESYSIAKDLAVTARAGLTAAEAKLARVEGAAIMKPEDLAYSATPTSVIVYLSAGEALALAQLVKRITWNAIEAHAVDRDEAEVMRDALERLRRGLADSGFNPR